MLREILGELPDLLVEVRLRRVGRALDVTVDVAAGSDGVEEGAVDSLDSRLEVLLDWKGRRRRHLEWAKGI